MVRVDMSMRILNTIGGVYSGEGRQILDRLGEVDYLSPTQSELQDIIKNYDAAVIGIGLIFDKKILDGGTRLKYIATATTGLDHIDLEYAKKKGIEIISLRGENEFLDTITGTAELAMGLTLALFRRIPHAFDAVKRHEWEREKFRGYNLHGKTLGIVGLGRLGKMMSRYGHAFGMNVLFTDPYVTESQFVKSSLENLLKESDVVSIHVHLNAETENLFNIERLRKMKKGAFLINTSRGKIVDEDHLLEVLREGHLGGYATDVLADELSFEASGFNSHPLVEYAKINENVIIVPHIGGMTHESRVATDVFIAEKLRKAIT